MKRGIVLAAATALAAFGATRAVYAQIPVRDVAAPSVATATPLGSVLGMRELPDGRVLIDDAGKLRLLLFSADLKTFTVVADTAEASKNKYGTSPGSITPYVGDSTLLSLSNLRAFLLIDPRGSVARIAAVPKPADTVHQRQSHRDRSARATTLPGAARARARSPATRPRDRRDAAA
jgi:hypothetical protein